MELHVRVVERKTGSASTYALRREMFSRSEYAGFVSVHKELEQLAGTPPFEVKLGKKEETALSFEDLRKKILDVAREGVPLQRFKGLGEMNPDQLFDTTMDAEKRTLQQVTVDDASRCRPDVLDADGGQGRAQARVHRGQRPRRDEPGRLDGQRRDAVGRQHRAPRARGGDAVVVPRLRDERDRGAGVAGRPRRPQAGAPARAVLDARVGPPAQPALPQVRERCGRRDGQLPSARRLGDLRRARAPRPGLRHARAAGRRAGQFRLDRQRSGSRDEIHRGAAGEARHGDAPRHRRGHRRLHAELRRHAAGALGAPVAVPEPPGQRLGRHRGRHGHEHPAAQPRRDDRRHRRVYRQPADRRRRADEAHQGPRLPHRRHHRRLAGH